MKNTMINSIKQVIIEKVYLKWPVPETHTRLKKEKRYRFFFES